MTRNAVVLAHDLEALLPAGPVDHVLGLESPRPSARPPRAGSSGSAAQDRLAVSSSSPAPGRRRDGDHPDRRVAEALAHSSTSAWRRRREQVALREDDQLRQPVEPAAVARRAPPRTVS